MGRLSRVVRWHSLRRSAAQPEVACAGQQLWSFRSVRRLIDGIVEDLDGVELIEGDGSVGQLGGILDEGLAHVDAHLGDGIDRCRGGREIIGNAATVAASLPSVAKTRGRDRCRQRARYSGGHAGRRSRRSRHSRDGREIGARSGAFDVVVNDAP